jgi:DNA-binding CsgD family transcriptional regulator
VGSIPDLERGRQFFARSDWQAAYDALTAADLVSPLEPAALDLLAQAAYMLGRDDEYVGALERAYRAHLQADAPLPAVRSAFWIGHSWLFRGQLGPALGWFARAERLLDRQERDVVERGYVLVAKMLDHLMNGDVSGAHDTAAEIVGIGERFGDKDLVALGMMEQGHALVTLGRLDEGVRLIDETMVAVTSGELSPIVAGIVYCNTIAICRDVYQVRRVREWTAALTRWCALQPDMVAHKGVCLVHRAEVMTLSGAWDDALEELRRFGEHFTAGTLNRLSRGDAAYREGEVRRLRAEFDLAEEAYRTASALGREPLPGLALMRLAQGRPDAAAATIRRAVSESPRGLPRVALLPAYIEVMLADGDVEAAAVGSREFDEIAARQGSELIDAMSGQARGALCLAQGDAYAALTALRRALGIWQELEAPYDAARTRTLIGQACQMLGDDEAAALELRAARDTLAELGATIDLAALVPRGEALAPAPLRGLTPREREVLQLVATGKSNREISAVLVLSEHTVARHLQNIFAKLGVSSRTAASAFAYRHGLV